LARGSCRLLLLRGFVLMTFSGWLATLAGWYVTEIGRQPWLVTGVLTTAQAAVPVPAASIGTTLAMYLTPSMPVLLSAYIATLYRLAAKGRISEAVPGNAPIPQTA
jgi:cytochrome d ubiquinol oxidase subunit I